MANWVKVFETKNIYKAELLKNELLTHEVMAVVINKTDSITHLIGNYEIQVTEEQQAIAKIVTDTFNQNDLDIQPTS